MPLIFILAMASLLGAPTSEVSLFLQDPSAGSSTQSVPSVPTDSAPAAAKDEPPAVQQTDSTAKKKAESARSQRTKNRRRRKAARAGEPRKIVIREGGATEPSAKILPGLAPQEAGQQRENTENLLARTEENLKKLAGRTLDSPRQETVAQIHNYVEGARSALKDGDTQRAHTLALKANLLADDLLKN